MKVHEHVFYDHVEDQLVIISSPITYRDDYEFIFIGEL